MEISKAVYIFLKDCCAKANKSESLKDRYGKDVKAISYEDFSDLLISHPDIHPSTTFKKFNNSDKNFQKRLIEDFIASVGIFPLFIFSNDTYGYVRIGPKASLSIEEYESKMAKAEKDAKALELSKEANNISVEANKKAKIANKIAIISLIASALISVISLIVAIYSAIK